MKFSLMAKSCLCPGLITLVTNLIKSSVEPPRNFENKDDAKWGWLKDYWDGKDFEIYREVIPSSYEGKTFCSIVNQVFKEEDELLLFALEIVVNDQQGDIMINPGNYKLPYPPSYSTDKFTYYGYFIAGDADAVKNIAIFKEAENNFARNMDTQL